MQPRFFYVGENYKTGDIFSAYEYGGSYNIVNHINSKQKNSFKKCHPYITCDGDDLYYLGYINYSVYPDKGDNGMIKEHISLDNLMADFKIETVRLDEEYILNCPKEYTSVYLCHSKYKLEGFVLKAIRDDGKSSYFKYGRACKDKRSCILENKKGQKIRIKCNKAILNRSIEVDVINYNEIVSKIQSYQYSDICLKMDAYDDNITICIRENDHEYDIPVSINDFNAKSKIDLLFNLLHNLRYRFRLKNDEKYIIIKYKDKDVNKLVKAVHLI